MKNSCHERLFIDNVICYRVTIKDCKQIAIMMTFIDKN